MDPQVFSPVLIVRNEDAMGERKPPDSESEEEGEAEVTMTEEDLQELEYVKGGYSPRLFQPADLTIDAVIYDEADDEKKLALARKQVITTGRVKVISYFHC